MIFKLIKFGVVGFSGLLIDFLFTYIFKELLKINKYISNSLGFIIAASTNYILNRIWTFESTNPKVLFEYTSFLVISIIGLFINNFFLYIFEKQLNNSRDFKSPFLNTIKTTLNKFIPKGIDTESLIFYLSKLFAIAITTIWNFFANYLITFS